MNEYQAEILRVVDGDTLDCRVDLGFKVFAKIRCRLVRIDAPELATPEGQRAKELLNAYMNASPKVTIKTHNQDRYGRWLTDITLPDGTNLSDWALNNQIARVY